MEEYPSFMTCVLRVDINAVRWQRTIAKVLKHIDEANFRMNKDGTVEISGTVFPNKFLRRLRKSRKKVELCHFQFGECSSNLFLPPPAVNYAIPNPYGRPNNMLISSLIGQKDAKPAGYYGGRDGRFLHYGDKPSQLQKSKDSSKGKTHHDHDHVHNHKHNHGHDHVHNHNHGHDHDHNHVHGRDRDKHERKLEHAAGCSINATTPRPKVQLDCQKQMKGRAEPLQNTQGVNNCCLM